MPFVCVSVSSKLPESEVPQLDKNVSTNFARTTKQLFEFFFACCRIDKIFCETFVCFLLVYFLPFI